MRLRTQRRKGKGRCCVFSSEGKRVACFARAADAQALSAVVKKSRVSVACSVSPPRSGRR